MKIVDIISSATSNMGRSKVRTGLTILAIFIGAFTITLTVGISSGVTAYINKQVNSVGAENVLVIQRNIELNTSNELKEYNPERQSESQSSMAGMILYDEDIDAIKSQSGLSNFYPVSLVSPSYVVGSNDKKYQINTQPFVDGSEFDVISGKLISNKNSFNEVLLPVTMVKTLGFKSESEAIGKSLKFGISNAVGEISEVEAKVSGVLQESIITTGGIFINKNTQEEMYSIQSSGLPIVVKRRYMAVAAEFSKNASKDDVSLIKKELLEQGYIARTVDDQIGVIRQVIDAITYVLIFFGGIALLAASIGIINTLYMSVQERTKEIGLMKAMGMSRFKVFLLFSIEAVLIGFWGSLIGSLSAIGVGSVANKIASDSFLKDLPGFDLTYFPILSVMAVIVFIMLVAFLAGTLPSRKAANQDPIEALRYE